MIEDMNKVVDIALEKYPAKAFKTRKSHIVIKTKEEPSRIVAMSFCEPRSW